MPEGEPVAYRLVIFDFDGTLADSLGWMRGVLNDVARRHRFRTAEDHELEELRGKDTRAIMAHLGVSPWKLPFIARDMRRRAAREAHLIRPFAGVHELLADLAGRGRHTAIVSSNAEANVRAVLGPESAARVRFYACGAGLFGKQAKFRRVLRRSGTAPVDTIAIGDEARDIQAAAGEGIASGAVTWGYATPELLRAHRPTVMFDDSDVLRRFLLGDG
jgi:phosphoglycolate phosphatase